MSKRYLYSDDFYKDFGEQPELLEINIGQHLLPLVEGDNKKGPLLKAIQEVRNKCDAEFGLLLPKIRIRDSMWIEPDEYAIILSGNEVAKGTVKIGCYHCIDTGSVRTPIENNLWEKTKEPAFGMDAYIIPESEKEKFRDAGYLFVPPENVIREHFYQIIRANITKILNQSMVNELVEKVRNINPDVITDVFISKRFSISNMKIVLNRLLEEGISIRDMNTILETVADYLDEVKKPLVLAEKVRERLAAGFLKDYAEDGKNLHVFRLPLNISNTLVDKLYYPESKIDKPYLALDPADRKKLIDAISKCCSWFTEHVLTPVFICVSNLRLSFADFVHGYMPDAYVISDLEMYAAKDLVTVTVEGEVEVDD